MSVSLRGFGSWVGKSEAAGPSKLVPGNLTFPISPACLGWTWGVPLSGPTPSNPQPLCCPRSTPDLFGFSILDRAARLWESHPSVPWAQPRHAITLAGSLRQAWAGDRKEEKESCSRPDKRQKPAPEHTAWRLGGCPGWRGRPGLACPGRSQVGACFLRVFVLLAAGHLQEPHVGP